MVRCALFALWVLVLCGSAQGNWMPVGEKLQRVESEHFVYIYEAPLAGQVSNLVQACEDAHALLAPLFRWAPRAKTSVLFHDAWDEHNGAATVYPRPTIEILAADSVPRRSIYEPGNYIRRTVFHEYAHVLALDAQYGFGAVLARIFGRVESAVGDPLSVLLTLLALPPNNLAPTWYLEGLSIWAETEFVGPGRGRSTLADMILRMPVADNRVLSPPAWDLDLPEWPYGQAAYLYGMRALEYAHDKYLTNEPPRNVPGELANSVAHTFLYFFDRRASAVVGESFGRLARNALKAERKRQAQRILELKKAPLTPLARLTPERLQVVQPKFGPDGAAVYFAGSGEAERDTLYRYDLAAAGLTKIRAARTQTSISGLAAAADRRQIYFTRLNVTGRDRYLNELQRYDIASERVESVTARGRYRYPALHPDGKRLAAVRNAAGRYELLEVPLAAAGQPAQETVRLKAENLHAIIDPVYSPDGRFLVYVLADESGSQLRRLDLESGTDEVLLAWPCKILAPAFHPAGDLLVFSADRSGVFNLYRLAFQPGAVARPLTHVLGGLFDPDFSPDGRRLAASSYDSYGYHLVIFDFGELRPIDTALPRLQPVWRSLPANERSIQARLTEPPPGISAAQPYRSLAAIRPDYWSPWLTASGDGVVGGVVASFSDPTAYQSLTVLGGYDSSAAQPEAALVYKYSGAYPEFKVYGTLMPDTYADLVMTTNRQVYDYGEQVSAGGAAIAIPWYTVDHEWLLTLGYQYTDRRVIGTLEEDYRGTGLLTTNLYEGGEGALFAQLEFYNGTAYNRSHSVEDGRYVSAGAEWSNPALGGELSRGRVLGQWDEYLTMPWSQNHVLKFEGLAGTGWGDDIAQGSFGLGGYGTAQAAGIPGLERNATLRGYEDNTQVGQNLFKAGVAYRFPIVRVYRGVTATLPLYLKQLFAEVYYEGGKAWGGAAAEQRDNAWINSAGAELNFSTTLLRLLDVAPGLGVAYAFDRQAPPSADEEDHQGGDDKLQVYLTLKASVNF
jgi:Tol biopolymer transport system component